MSFLSKLSSNKRFNDRDFRRDLHPNPRDTSKRIEGSSKSARQRSDRHVGLINIKGSQQTPLEVSGPHHRSADYKVGKQLALDEIFAEFLKHARADVKQRLFNNPERFNNQRRTAYGFNKI